MASKWHFNDFRHVPCRQVLGQALMTKHAQCSPTNLKETTLWQGHFCQVHVSNCKETDSFGAITSIGHQNAKDLKLMGLPNEKSKHVSTAIMYTMSEIETCIFTLPIEGTWWNMMEHGKGWNLHKPTSGYRTSGQQETWWTPMVQHVQCNFHQAACPVAFDTWLNSASSSIVATWNGTADFDFVDFSAICRSSANITR